MISITENLKTKLINSTITSMPVCAIIIPEQIFCGLSGSLRKKSAGSLSFLALWKIERGNLAYLLTVMDAVSAFAHILWTLIFQDFPTNFWLPACHLWAKCT